MQAPHLARGITLAVLGAFASVYLLAGVPIAIVVFALQLVHVLPVLRRFRGPMLFAVQAGAGFWGVLASGASVGMLGFLAGSLLLTPLWPLAPAVAAAAAVIGSVRYGEASATADATITMILIALVVYGLTRLTERVDQLYSARLALAAAAVAEERLRIAAELSDGLGRGLVMIAEGGRRALAEPEHTAEILGQVAGTARRALAEARTAASGYRAMSLAPEITTARAMLAAAGVTAHVRVGHAEPLGPAGALLAAVLREAVTEVVRRGTATTCEIETDTSEGGVRLRVSNDGVRTAEDESLSDLPGRVAEAGGSLATGLSPTGRFTVSVMLPCAGSAPSLPPDDRHASVLSLTLLAVVLAGFSAKALLRLPAGSLLPAAACLGLILLLQLRLVSGRHLRSLAAMALLTYLPIPAFGEVWLGVAGFLSGPLLLAFPAVLAWPLVASVTASAAVIGVVLGLEPAVTVNYTVSTLVTGLVVHGLLRLALLAEEVQAVKEELARSAVVEERLRAARDLHDLLGHSMAAILLRCELARRLDPVRARAEIEDVLGMVEKAEADMRSVSGERHEMSLAAEAESARSLLGAAGIDVTVELGHGRVAAEVETVLSTVLREAVTNVLRHSAARRCTIATDCEQGEVRLRVRNDGVRPDAVPAAVPAPDRTAGRRGSAGVGNLTTRLAALGGSLTTTRDGERFEIEARVPTASLAMSVPAG
ncbi:two-component sensor histidine kinase [Planobispora rosea]|uniref:Two-component sensor histidine kinase n=1 Tax=Planobispora rosea TaxID=35762 RepID=A0A8J3WDK5_PLARO|nr:histidine kinase [Planobispora rosea]GGS71194.1 two-component sensor histidine kinase [Planobispora rosea]GIH85445.1 two-component sensor histidine kinase [Planobispora rosea]